MTTAFQKDAFQNDAFQIDVSTGVIGTTPRLQGGSPGGYVDPRYSSLTRTKDLPGLKSLIEKDDERIIEMVADLIIKGKLH